ncbi:hypothetical protein K7X08_037649 [Anisodus acutangulus]|uniref:Uncharacterized protein n=1 Tax=Anisodus acutangulus TaxID=402998 RepID=A0A9Q1N0R1_9SOLA|nr:hypothetical protein K7X08_037649 [Anisodus acutangulus]
MDGDLYPHLHQFISRQQQQQHNQCHSTSGEIISYQKVNIDAGELGDGDRFPQWSVDETWKFLMIRGELEQNFMKTKCTKLLWGVIANKMKFKGYNAVLISASPNGKILSPAISSQ